MLKKVELAYIRRMARMYERFDDMPRRAAIFQAYKSYDYFSSLQIL
jgi:hypothetical protein